MFGVHENPLAPPKNLLFSETSKFVVVQSQFHHIIYILQHLKNICDNSVKGSQDPDYRKIAENMIVDNVYIYNANGYRNATLNRTQAKMAPYLSDEHDFMVEPDQICMFDCENWQPNYDKLDVRNVNSI